MRPNTIDDFWKKVNKETDSGCWEWTGAQINNGYGQWGYQGKVYLAHRIIMKLLGHEIEGFDVLHKCDNPSCVNPDHLFIGTHTDNMKDMVAKGRNVSPNAGKKLSEEQRNKIRKSNLGLKRTNEQRRNISIATKQGWEKRKAA